MIREIVVDTETTGLDPSNGHKIIEIGAVELVNYMPTRHVFHAYINPMRSIPSDSFRIHGITNEMLRDKPTFKDIKDDFLAFIQDDPLVIHNAVFDIAFLNSELKAVNVENINNSVKDTLILARQKFPGERNSLDALCRRFKIDLSERKKHGALLDARLLALVYIELLDGLQHGLAFDKCNEENDPSSSISNGCSYLRPMNMHSNSKSKNKFVFPYRKNKNRLSRGEENCHKDLTKRLAGNIGWNHKVDS